VHLRILGGSQRKKRCGVRERERNRKKQKQKTGHTHIRVYFLHLECLEERGKKKGMRE
jgi:hypothetical protein